MDETQLVFIGFNYFTGAVEIVVLNFGQIKPFCEKHEAPYSVYSGHSKLEVLEHFRRKNASITKNISFSRCVSNEVDFFGSRKCYDSLVLLTLAPCAILFVSIALIAIPSKKSVTLPSPKYHQSGSPIVQTIKLGVIAGVIRSMWYFGDGKVTRFLLGILRK